MIFSFGLKQTELRWYGCPDVSGLIFICKCKNLVQTRKFKGYSRLFGCRLTLPHLHPLPIAVSHGINARHSFGRRCWLCCARRPQRWACHSTHSWHFTSLFSSFVYMFMLTTQDVYHCSNTVIYYWLGQIEFSHSKFISLTFITF